MADTTPRSSRLRSEHDRTIAKLAVPALGTLVAEPLYVLTDTAIVGRIGTNELGGLALASTVLLTAHAVLIFLAYGTTAAVSRLIGADQPGAAADRSVQALWLAAGFGVLTIALVSGLGTPMLELLGGEGEVLAAAELYLGISIWGFPFLLLTMSAGGSFYGRQNTVTPLVLAVAGAVANLVIEVVLIYGFGYGLGASALATVIAQIGTGVVSTVLVLRWAGTLGIGPRPVWATMRLLLDAGKALVVRTVALRGSFTLSAAVAARIGVAELAAHQIVLQVWGTLTLALDAVAIAGQSLTGTYLGAGDTERARGAARRMIELDVVFGIVAGLVLVIARQPIAQLFSTDPDVVAATAFVLLFVAVQQPVNSVVFALDGILIGAGDLTYLAQTMVAATGIFTILAIVVAISGAGLGWLWAALGVFMLLRAGFMWRRWRDDVWLVTGA